MSWLRRNRTVVLPLTVVVSAGVAYLAFGVFGVHTLFIDDKVDEDGPIFDSGVAEATDETIAPAVTDAPIDQALTERSPSRR